jgi:hypothetical protein
VITDREIREYRGDLFGASYDYDAWLTCQIALGNRMPHKNMSREQARSMIADLLRAFVEAVIVRELNPGLPPGARVECLTLCEFGLFELEWSVQ